MIPLTFTVPTAFSDPDLYRRFGAIIKDNATGQIVAHIQETGAWGLLRHLPIPGGNPLKLVTEGVQIAQLARIQQTLNAVQSLATIGAVSSVASLGVSVAGFAVVLAKLKRMDGKLDRVLADTARLRSLAERMNVKLDALPLAKLRAELEEIRLSSFYEPDRRRQSLQSSVRELALLRHYYSALLSSEEFCLQGTDGLLAILDTHERLVAACQGELLAEFLLDGDARVIEERWQTQQQAFDSVAWQSPEMLYELVEQGDRDAGVYLVTPPTDRRSKVLAVTDVRSESMARLASLPYLAMFLENRGVSNREYVRLLQETPSDESEPLIAVDAR